MYGVDFHKAKRIMFKTEKTLVTPLPLTNIIQSIRFIVGVFFFSSIVLSLSLIFRRLTTERQRGSDSFESLAIKKIKYTKT